MVFHFIVDLEVHSQCFCLCWIVIYLLLDKAENVAIINPYYKAVLGFWLIINLHFYKGMETTQGNGKREERFTTLASLLGGYHMLTDCKLSELCMLV